MDGKCGPTHRRRQKDTFRLIHAACSEPADVSDDHALTGLCTGTLRCRFDDCELLVRGSSVLLRTGKGFNTDNFRRAFGSSCSSGPLLRVGRQVFLGRNRNRSRVELGTPAASVAPRGMRPLGRVPSVGGELELFFCGRRVTICATLANWIGIPNTCISAPYSFEI